MAEKERWMGEKVYPIQPDTLQRFLLLQLLKGHLAKLESEDTPESRRQHQSLRPLYEALDDSEGELKAFYMLLVSGARDRHKAGDIDYAIMKVSERKYCVLKRSIPTHANFTNLKGFGPYNEKDFMPVINYKRITGNVNHEDAEQIYAHLVHGKELPESLKVHVSEDAK
jgi:hypothetical protein